jgi:hypothetical protein
MQEPHVDQAAGAARLLFCCNVQETVSGQETMTLSPLRVMVSQGNPGYCTTEMRLQKPPVSE